jgi:hypothetical protein
MLLIVLVMAMPVWAGSDDILGAGLNQDKDAEIEIYKVSHTAIRWSLCLPLLAGCLMVGFIHI